MNYLIIGAGGTGGVLGASLFRKGFPVTLIARGGHLEQIQKKGLTVQNRMTGTAETFRIPARTAEAFTGKADVIFVCVKGYSLPDLIPFLDRVSDAETVVIPLLNIFTTGETLRKQLPGRYVLDGCIYVSANIEQPGLLLQHSRILKVVYGTVPGQAKKPVLETIRQNLTDAGAAAVLSDAIRRDALKKFCYVSPIGAAGLYLHATAGDFQKEGPARTLFIGLMKEVEALAAGIGCPFDEDVIGNNLRILSRQPPEAATSLQRDVCAGKQSEIEGLIFGVPALGRQVQVEMPLYTKVADALKQRMDAAEFAPATKNIVR